MELNFDQFYEFTKKKLNLDLHAYKQKQLQRRITTVMNSSGAKTLEEYAKLIENDNNIKQRFLDYITINVTEFFRNKDIFEVFEKVVKENLNPKFGGLKIWSAACSIGSEPYSLGIIMDKNNLKIKDKILATDIDEEILNKAKKGIYKEAEIKNIDSMDLKKYFTLEEKKYTIDNKIKSMIDFKKHDLILGQYETGFHIIICRNVTIYFKNEVKDEIYKKFNDSLVRGGILFTGATESLYNPEKLGFKKLSTFIYEKV